MITRWTTALAAALALFLATPGAHAQSDPAGQKAILKAWGYATTPIQLACYANGSEPTAPAPTLGDIACSTTDSAIRFYNGAAWTSVSGGGGALPVGTNNNVLTSDGASGAVSEANFNFTGTLASLLDGTALVMGNAAQITAGAVDALQVLGTGAADSRALIGRFSADAVGPDLSFVKSRNAAIGNTIVADDDVIGRIVAYPADGVDYATEAAVYQMEVDDATPAAGDVGMAHVWSSMPGGGGAIAEKMRLSAAGNLTPGVTDAGALGTTSLMWSDLFLASGGVLNFNNGNYTLTHSAGALAANGTFSATTLTATAASSLALGTASSADGAVIFRNATNANTLTITSGATGAGLTFTLPTAYGTPGYALVDSDGAGTLGWAAGGGAWSSAAGETTPDTATDLVVIGQEDAGTNNVLNKFQLQHTSSGTPVAGFGVSQNVILDDGSNVERIAAIIETRWTDPATATADALIDFKVMVGAAAASSHMTVGDNKVTIPNGVAFESPGAGANSFKVGPLAAAGGGNSTAGGPSASAAGLHATAYGYTANASAQEATAIGDGTVASGLKSVALGDEAQATGSTSIAIGQQAKAGSVGAGGVAIGGLAASAQYQEAIALGYGSYSSATGAISIGGRSDSRGASSVALGYFSQSLHDGSICLGANATSTATNQLVIGNVAANSNITAVYIGEGVTSATPQDLTISATNASGADVGTGDLIIAAGLPNGAATAGPNNVGRILFTTTDGVSATPHVATTVMTLGTDAVGTSPTVDFNVEARGIVDDNATNTVVNALNLKHTSSGAPAAGFGVSQNIILDDDANVERTAVIIETGWTSAATANADAYIDFKVMENSGAASSVLRIDPGILTNYDVTVSGNLRTTAALYTAGVVSAGGTVTGTSILAAGGYHRMTSIIVPMLLLGGSGASASAFEFQQWAPLTATSGTQYGLRWTGTSTNGFAPTSGTADFIALDLSYVINQTGGANGDITGILYDATETAVLGTHTLLDLQVGSVSQFSVANDGRMTTAADSIVITGTQSPGSGDACTAGEIAWDASYIYVCTASGAWKRAALTGAY